MVLGMLGDLAEIREPQRSLRRDMHVEAGIDYRGIARERHSGDVERRTERLEGERRGRRYVAEGMLPCRRDARPRRWAGPMRLRNAGRALNSQHPDPRWRR